MLTKFRKVISLLLVAILFIQGPLAVFADVDIDGKTFTVSKRFIKLGNAEEIVITASAASFSDGYTSAVVSKDSVSTPLTIKTQTETELVLAVPNTVLEGTYNLTIGDPLAPTNVNNGKAYDLGILKVGNATVLESGQLLDLPLGYNESVDLTLQGDLCNFEVGKTTIELLDGSVVTTNPTVKSIDVISDYNRNLVMTIGTGLTTGSYDIKVTTDDEIITLSDAVVVRGQASISSSVISLNEGYVATEITITGTDTGFSNLTSVQIFDGLEDQSAVSGLTVLDENNLKFTVNSGLMADGVDIKSYLIKVETGIESAEVDLSIKPVSMTLKNDDGSAEVTEVARSGESSKFRVDGINTDFISGQTSVILVDESDQEESGKVSSVTILDSEHLTFNLDRDISEGSYKIRVSTGDQIIEDSLTVVAPTLTLISYSSIFDIVNGETLGEGYQLFSVLLEGSNFDFANDSTVLFTDGSTEDNLLINNIAVNGSKLNFDIKSGLTSGNYDIIVDIDGNASTTFDQFTTTVDDVLSFEVVSPDFASVTPTSVVNLTDKEVSVQGVDTHFESDGTYEIQIKNTDGSVAKRISSVTVESATSLKFNIPANEVADGIYGLTVIMTKGSYTEEITADAVLTVASKGIEKVTPEYIFIEQMDQDFELIIYGEGTSFSNLTQVYVDGVRNNDVVLSSDSEMVITVNGLSEGTHTLKVVDGDPLSEFSFIVRPERGMNLSESDILTFYSDEKLYLNGENMNFKLGDTGVNTPTVLLNSQALNVTLSESSDSIVVVDLPDGLISGDYLLEISFDHSDSIYSDVSFTQNFTIEKRYTDLKFYSGDNEINSLVKNVTDANVSIVGKGIVSGTNEIEDLGNRAQINIKSGSGYVTLSNGNLSFVGAGNAVLEITCDGLTKELSIKVNNNTDTNPPSGNTGSGGGYVPPSTVVDKDIVEETDTPNLRTDEMDSLTSSKDVNKLVDEINELVGLYLEKEDTTLAQAETVVETFIENNILVALDKDVDGNSRNLLIEKAKNISSQLIKKAGTIDNLDIEVSIGKTLITVDVKVLEKAIAKSIETNNKFTNILNSGGVNLPQLNNEIVIQIGNTSGNISFNLDDEAINKLKNSNVNLTVVSKGVSFNLTSDVLQNNDGVMEMKITNNAVNKVLESKIISAAKDSKGNTLNAYGDTFDLSMNLKSDNKDVGVDVEISMPLSGIDLSKVDVDTLGIYVYDEVNGSWEYVPGYVKGEKLVCIAPHFSIYKIMSYNSNLLDIDKHWAKDTIEFMANKRIVNGVGSGMFNPNAKITRAEFATILVNMLNLDGKLVESFIDVNENDWYHNTVTLAKQAGLISGVGNNTFAPSNNVTREQMATMISKAYSYSKGFELKGSESFSDFKSISSYAVTPVASMKYNGIINGYSDNSFKPKEYATRAEATSMIKNLWILLNN